MHIVDHLSHELGAESGEPCPRPDGCICQWNDLDYGWVMGTPKPGCLIHGIRSHTMAVAHPEQPVPLRADMYGALDSYNPANIGKRESSDGVNTITVYASIGNSDDKLGQREWADFVREMTTLVGRYASEVYGWWFSTPDKPWQNAVCAFLLDTYQVERLRVELTALRVAYRQDSVAWAVAARTEFI